ncbi:hypothetical protein B0T26DRAFT_806742 [Lasiosphaeria miniovina]|uniref:Uncharacterized protein n=1 Tax=Lasiosphaeria miniovina TaxID=1954250 RepID=A0AA40DL23_9PEZI|nr:uncharacterized protein B0T26DRAFT_806742 [Lasiosphaeria miniovina]KAK0707150.1 hypothetical protein B0T26DRAFT_806742 [Lasiosphaeria miniovina]
MSKSCELSRRSYILFFTHIAGVFAALTSSARVLAQQQTNNQTGLFLLKLASTNETLSGNYPGACHAGAAIGALCLIGKNVSAINRSAATFFWNYTIYDGQPSEAGSRLDPATVWRHHERVGAPLFVGSYYYNALAWVTSGTPHNPTCQAVGVLKEDALETSVEAEAEAPEQDEAEEDDNDQEKA